MNSNRSIIPWQGLVVSCQALEDEPLHGSAHMAAMARAAQSVGANGIRANSEADIRAIKAKVKLPLIGLRKRTVPGFSVFITPTLEDALSVHAAGADIVAIDGTGRPRPDGRTLEETVAALKSAGVPVMADIATFDEGVRAAQLGVDYVSTTLSGYTEDTADIVLPNMELLARLTAELEVPVVAEGGIHQPEQAAEALRRGAAFVVVGSAITRPQWIAARYAEAMRLAAAGMREGRGE